MTPDGCASRASVQMSNEQQHFAYTFLSEHAVFSKCNEFSPASWSLFSFLSSSFYYFVFFSSFSPLSSALLACYCSLVSSFDSLNLLCRCYAVHLPDISM